MSNPGKPRCYLQDILDIVSERGGRIINQWYKLWKQYGPAKTFYQVLGTQDFLEYKKDEDDDSVNLPLRWKINHRIGNACKAR